MFKRLGQNRGFTLIELMVVLAVLGVLAAIVVPNVAGYVRQGKQRSFTADQRILQAAVDAWRTDTANRVGNAWPTVGGVKGTPSAGVDTDFVDTGDTNSIIKVSDLSTGSFIKSTDTVKSFKYSDTVTGTTGATNSPVGSYYWFIDSGGLVIGWYDANDDKVVDSGETGFQDGIYP
ncbi:MAG: type II secretion system protein [Chloroflexi bacterium]|nr:type II secretion system protein [Chloroflexota bacterium]